MKTLKKVSLFILLGVIVCSCRKEETATTTNTTTSESKSYNSFIYSSVDVSQDVVYGKSTTQGGKTEDLLMDVYTGKGDNSLKRPLIILAHGGGFTTGDKESMTDLAQFFAKSGYVAVSLKYRLVDVQESSEVMIRGVIDGMHDMRAAVRFFRKDLAGSNNYRIDDQNIFAGGYSAGGFMGLHTAYLNSNSEILELGGQALLDFVTAQGGLEGKSGNAGYSSSIRGCISLAGALGKASFINAGEPVLYSFHGTGDQVVPYYTGDSDGSGVITEGPGVYHPIADKAGIVNRLYTVQNGSHDIFWDTQGSYEDLRNFISSNLSK